MLLLTLIDCLLDFWVIFFSVRRTEGNHLTWKLSFLHFKMNLQGPWISALTVIYSWNSTSNKELSPHVASVKSILENHASYLMSVKELSKLVAFVKGTQFDLVVRFSLVFSSYSHSLIRKYAHGNYVYDIKLNSGISSTGKTWLCSPGQFCIWAWIDWAKGVCSLTVLHFGSNEGFLVLA